MNCIVIEDEPLARAEMEALILELSDLELSGTFSNVPTAQVYLKDHKVDLIFLDIEMPLVSGIEFAENLPKETLVIFTTEGHCEGKIISSSAYKRSTKKRFSIQQIRIYDDQSG